jgi:hypothetical protein
VRTGGASGSISRKIVRVTTEALRDSQNQHRFLAAHRVESGFGVDLRDNPSNCSGYCAFNPVYIN